MSMNSKLKAGKGIGDFLSVFAVIAGYVVLTPVVLCMLFI